MSKKYERAEATFKLDDDLDMKLYNYILDKSKLIGKSSYIKILIYNEMIKENLITDNLIQTLKSSKDGK